jgi:hypothetical protein
MMRWFFWLIVRTIVLAVLDEFLVHDFETIAAFWGAFALVHLASVIDDAHERRARERMELP